MFKKVCKVYTQYSHTMIYEILFHAICSARFRRHSYVVRCCVKENVSASKVVIHTAGRKRIFMFHVNANGGGTDTRSFQLMRRDKSYDRAGPTTLVGTRHVHDQEIVPSRPDGDLSCSVRRSGRPSIR